MAEGFLAFVDKTELEIDAKPAVEIIRYRFKNGLINCINLTKHRSKRTSTRFLDVKTETDDKKKDKKKEKEKVKDNSDLPGGT